MRLQLVHTCEPPPAPPGSARKWTCLRKAASELSAGSATAHTAPPSPPLPPDGPPVSHNLLSYRGKHRGGINALEAVGLHLAARTSLYGTPRSRARRRRP